MYLCSIDSDRKKQPYFNNTFQLVEISTDNHACLIYLYYNCLFVYCIPFAFEYCFRAGLTDFTTMRVSFSDGPDWLSLVTLCPWSTVPDIPCNILAL